MINSFYFNDAIIFKNDVIETLNQTEGISSEKKAKIYTHISNTYNGCSKPKSSHHIPLSCRISYPLYKKDNSGQLDLSIEYNFLGEKENDSEYDDIFPEIIIGIYKPNGGNLDTDAKDIINLINPKINYKSDDKSWTYGLNLYKKKSSYYKKFNTCKWVSAVKINLKNECYETNKSKTEPIIANFISIIKNTIIQIENNV